MIVQPNKTTLQATVVDVQPDTSVQGKSWVELVIVSIQKTEGPQFLSAGKLIRSFTFEQVSALKKGDTLQGDIEVLGDAFHQTYQLSNVIVMNN